MPIHKIVIGVCCASLLSGIDVVADAGQEEVDDWHARSTSPLQLSISGGTEYQFNTDTSAGGDFSVISTGIGVGFTKEYAPDKNLSISLGYGLDTYDFSMTAVSPFLVDPWDSIHTLSAAAVLSVDMTNEFTMFGGPVIQFQRETGADWEDSLNGGGVIGGAYQYSDDLIIGGGIGVVSQIEDDVRVFPLIVVHWNISEKFRLASQTSQGASGRQGIELIFHTESPWEIAIGAANEFSRFRLSDEAGPGGNPFRGGVAEDRSTPIWLRMSRSVTRNSQIDLLGGMTVGGEIQIDDNNGNFITSTDYDTAFFIGIYGSIQF